MEEERKKTQLDYPASHSIDTYWFAVDKDGRLACICSGEEGTLPADIEKSNDDYEMTDDAIFITSEPICDGCRKFILSETDLSRLYFLKTKQIIFLLMTTIKTPCCLKIQALKEKL